jgi:2-dehydro-3-deoxy-D-arabinonate dehydratase
MQLGKVRYGNGSLGVVRVDGDSFIPLDMTLIPGISTLADVLFTHDPLPLIDELLLPNARRSLKSVKLLAPIDEQEVWAAGVTYKRSKVAREEESAGAAQFYDKVYNAPRPELFLKATPSRVSHPGDAIRVRKDATWNVPEPELTLAIAPDGTIVGYTIGNDVSSRDIEGENPLYLPQAKIYHGSCALGPVVTLAQAAPNILKMEIKLTIERGGQVVFEGTTNVDQITRTLTSLSEWLFRENSFPNGAFLMTGTGIVPPDAFSLATGDIVSIRIGELGTLVNPVGM